MNLVIVGVTTDEIRGPPLTNIIFSDMEEGFEPGIVLGYRGVSVTVCPNAILQYRKKKKYIMR